MNNRIGAPLGGRVHWLIWNLTSEFKGAYLLKYDYARHNYMFYRMDGRKIYDVFIVVRTSKRCFRVMYVNTEKLEWQYFSCKRSLYAARRMVELYKEDEKRSARGKYSPLSSR